MRGVARRGVIAAGFAAAGRRSRARAQALRSPLVGVPGSPKSGLPLLPPTAHSPTPAASMPNFTDTTEVIQLYSYSTSRQYGSSNIVNRIYYTLQSTNSYIGYDSRDIIRSYLSSFAYCTAYRKELIWTLPSVRCTHIRQCRRTNVRSTSHMQTFNTSMAPVPCRWFMRRSSQVALRIPVRAIPPRS